MTGNTKKKFLSAVDMTQGNPAKQILIFSLPLLLGDLLQQLYNTVDSMILGNFVGSNALAAVGTSLPVVQMMIAFFMGLSVGASILIAQAYGGKDFVRLQRVINTIYTLTFCISALIAVVGVIFTPVMLRMLSTPEETFEMAQAYMRVTFVGIVSMMMYQLVRSTLNGTGDSRSLFVILFICSVINIGLDLLFVAVFRWGVQGVAWAQIIAQSSSVAFGVWKINRDNDTFGIRLRDMRINKDSLANIFRLGIPAGTQNTLQAVGNTMVQGIINGFGRVIMAANLAVIKVDSLCTLPIATFGAAITVYVGQNVGAKKYDRIQKGVWATLWMSCAFSIVVGAILFLWGNYPLMMFTQEADVIAAGMDKFHIVAPFYVTMAIYGVLSGAVRGQGKTTVPMIIAISTMFLGRVPAAYFLPNLIGANGLHWSLSIQWALEAVIIIIYYMIISKKGQIGANKHLLGENDAL